jgi:hypothetical protein
MENEAIARRPYEEVWNNRKRELLDELISPSHVLHNVLHKTYVPDPGVGPEAFKRQMTLFMTAFPDLHFAVEDIIEGQVRW